MQIPIFGAFERGRTLEDELWAIAPTLEACPGRNYEPISILKTGIFLTFCPLSNATKIGTAQNKVYGTFKGSYGTRFFSLIFSYEALFPRYTTPLMRACPPVDTPSRRTEKITMGHMEQDFVLLIFSYEALFPRYTTPLMGPAHL